MQHHIVEQWYFRQRIDFSFYRATLCVARSLWS